MSLLENDDKLAYDAITRRHIDKLDHNAFDSEIGIVKSNIFLPFKPEAIVDLTEKLKISKALSTDQRKEIELINKLLKDSTLFLD